MALQTATNPTTGERVVLVDKQWQPITQSATNKQGVKAYLVNGNWLTDQPDQSAAQQQPEQQVSEIPAQRRNTAQATGSLFPGMQSVGNIGAGLARGLVSIPSTVYGMFQGEGDKSLGQRTTEKLTELGADPESTAFQGGQVGGEVISTLPVGGVLALPFKTAAPAVATALRTSGISRTGAGTKTDAALRIGAGATVGGAAAGLTGGDAGIGAGIGAAIPVVGAAGGKIIEKAADVFKPSRLISARIADSLNNDPALIQQAKELLEQGKTVDEVAVLLNSSGLASLFDKSKGASNATRDLYNSLDAALLETRANKLAQTQQSVNALAQQNIPIATASPTAPRRAVKQALAGEAARLEARKTGMTGTLTAQQQAQEAALEARKTGMTGTLTAQQQAQEAALAAQRQGVQGNIANASQLELGQKLAEANKQVLENTRKNIIEPAYQKAFDAAPAPTINLSGVTDVAKGQRQELINELENLDLKSGKLLRLFGPKQVDDMVQGVPVKLTVQAPPITLADAHAIRQAINMDRAALKGSNESKQITIRKQLNEVYDALNTAIARDVAPEAKALFDDANELFKENIVKVHRTGQPSKLTRISTLNEPMLLPGDIVGKVMDNEGNALQFLKIFRQDPEAMKTLKTGVEDLYRQSVMSGGKAATPEAHAKFMFDNAKQLGALDNAGLGMSARLDEIGGQISGLTAAEKALAAQGKAIPTKVSEAFENEVKTLAAQGKAIPGKVSEAFKAEDEALKLASSTLGFRQTDKLRAAVIKDPEVASQALSRMGAPAKSSLARGVMLDAGNATDTLKHLIDNERGIMQVLKAHNPKTAQSVFNTAKETAELTKIIEQTGNKLGSTAFNNSMLTQQNINNLTQGLPEVRAVVDNIQKQIQTKEGFEKLAAQGQANVSKLFSEETKPHMFPLNKIWALANAILTRLEGTLDKELAVKLAMELAASPTAARAVGKAQEAARTQAPGKISKTAARALPVALQPENENALAP